MSEYTASNGVKVLILANGIGFQLPGRDPSTFGMNPEKVEALREYFQHEAAKQPWDDAKRGDVWLFRNEVDSQRALAWRGLDDWDVIDPRGSFHSRISDVAAEMEAHSYFGWDKPSAEMIYRIEDAS